MVKILKTLGLWLVILSMGMVLSGCKEDEDEDTSARQYYYDPRVPFGNIDLNATNILNVQNLQADISVLEKIKLTWKVPPLYTTLNYKVVIFKRKEPPADFNIVCPKPNNSITSLCPADEANAAIIYKYKELQANEFLDQNEIVEGEEIVNVAEDTRYVYWVFVQVNEKNWSSGVKLDIRSKKPGSTFELPPPAKFWEYKRWSLGFDPLGSNGIQFLQSMNAGNPELGVPKGGTAFASSGNIMYYADTANNRVIVYTRDGALSCESYTDEYEKQACLFQYLSAPLTARNILGQADADNTYPCGHVDNPLPTSECLTSPSRVTVIGNRLYISDSGNNRIVIYTHLPTNGCITDNGTGVTYPRDCTPNRVIGKAGLSDALNYDISIGDNGRRALSYPTDLAAYDGSLYIADTGNNRIVRIKNYADQDQFICTPDTWGSFLCEFTAVLGQPNFASKDYFEAMATADPSIIDPTGIKDKLAEDHKFLLKRYFRSPVRIKFTSNGKMLVAANERFSINNNIGGKSAIYGRIMIFDQDVINGDANSLKCNEATFNEIGGTDDSDIEQDPVGGPCAARYIIGQERFDKFLTVTGSFGDVAYNQNQAGQFSIDDFDVIDIPPANENVPGTQALITVSSVDNRVNFWYDWPNQLGDGYPKNAFATDPAGQTHPTTGQQLPDLEGLCAIRIVDDTSNIYVTDCAGSRVHEIQAQDFASP